MAAGGSGHGTRAVTAALLANLGIAVAKFVGFGLTGASSMLAESFHTVADSGNQAMLLAGGLELDPELSADDAARVIDQAQLRVREALPSARVIYLEPDLPSAVPESR